MSKKQVLEALMLAEDTTEFKDFVAIIMENYPGTDEEKIDRFFKRHILWFKPESRITYSPGYGRYIVMSAEENFLRFSLLNPEKPVAVYSMNNYPEAFRYADKTDGLDAFQWLYSRIIRDSSGIGYKYSAFKKSLRNYMTKGKKNYISKPTVPYYMPTAKHADSLIKLITFLPADWYYSVNEYRPINFVTEAPMTDACGMQQVSIKDSILTVWISGKNWNFPDPNPMGNQYNGPYSYVELKTFNLKKIHSVFYTNVGIQLYGGEVKSREEIKWDRSAFKNKVLITESSSSTASVQFTLGNAELDKKLYNILAHLVQVNYYSESTPYMFTNKPIYWFDMTREEWERVKRY